MKLIFTLLLSMMTASSGIAQTSTASPTASTPAPTTGPISSPGSPNNLPSNNSGTSTRETSGASSTNSANTCTETSTLNSDPIRFRNNRNQLNETQKATIDCTTYKGEEYANCINSRNIRK